jgi:protein SCO1
MSMIRRVSSLVLTAALLLAFTAGAQPLPETSVYQLALPLQTQDGQAATLDLHRGQPVLVSMFYTRCGYVCPLLLHSLQRLDAGLDPEVRGRMRVLVVSFDPEHDTPEVLAATAEKYRLDGTRWTLAQASAADVRKLAAALNIQYRQLPDGEFNHATIITLLDREGRIVARTSRPSQPESEFSDALRRVAGSP